MLSIFPQFLFLTPVAIALLRVTLGICILIIARHTFETRHAWTRPKFPLVGHAPEWLVLVAAVVYGLVGFLLIVGAYSQVAALIALIGSVKLLVLSRWYPELRCFPESTTLLLGIIALSLVATGAGAYAFDLPL